MKNWLLDGSIYFFRGYFGLPESLVDESGEPCGGVHGFASAFVDVLARHSGCPGAVAFDESLGSCFRNALYAGYKANRTPPDDNIIYQFAQCARLCELVGVASYASCLFEADDLLASLLETSEGSVIIYTLDKDLRQLVNSRCQVLDVRSGEGFDEAGFVRTYGFEPKLFPDYQALVGDSSDNVPGVPGLGPKTAGKLIARYGSLEAVFEAIEHWSADNVGVPSQGKLAASLRAHVDQALLMRSVLRLSREAPLPAHALRRQEAQKTLLAEFVQAKKLHRAASVLRQLGLLGNE